MDIHEIFKRPADEPKALRKRVQQLLNETKDPDLKKVVTILETLIH